MDEDEQRDPPKHVLDERRPISKPTCGAPLNAMAWAFTSIGHAILSLQQGAAITPCPECLRVVRDVIDAEIGDDRVAELEGALRGAADKLESALRRLGDEGIGAEGVEDSDPARLRAIADGSGRR